MIGNEDDLDRLLTRVLEDYRDDAEFFSEHRLPEYVVMEELSLEGRDLAQFLTFTCVTNHIHDDTGKSKKTDGEDGLWQVCARLWCEHPWMYRPEELVGDGRRAEGLTLFVRALQVRIVNTTTNWIGMVRTRSKSDQLLIEGGFRMTVELPANEVSQ